MRVIMGEERMRQVITSGNMPQFVWTVFLVQYKYEND
jgi:hypothetical protein